MTPGTLLQLANLGMPRRPARASTALTEPVLPDPATAGRQLASRISRLVNEADLPALRRVHQASAQAAEALLADRLPDCAALNALARGSTAHIELVPVDETLRHHLVWHDGSPAAELARSLIEELAAIEPNRLRRCARTACGLLFYDTTRSRTRRWHAEDPCGWRERQLQRRTGR